MRTIQLLIRCRTDDVHRDFQRITDFGRFPSLAEDVRAVEVHPAQSPDVPRDSDWEVNFRRGVMRWNEWESVDVQRLRIEFDQTDGDFAEFNGFWQLTPLVGASGDRGQAGGLSEESEVRDSRSTKQRSVPSPHIGSSTVGGCDVRFGVTYDFGIESLAGIMDPIAERVVKRVICSVLTGLFGEITILEGGEALTDLAGFAVSEAM